MAFCEHCGARLGAYAPTCGACGNPVPPDAADAPPPPPPPGHARIPQGRATPPPAPRAAVAVPAVRRGRFPVAAIPPLVAAVALIVTTAYATVYSLLRWGDISSPEYFFTGSAPDIVGGPLDGHIDNGYWFFDLPLSEIWVLGVPLLTIVVGTAILAAISRAGVAARLVAGALVAVPMAVFTSVLVLITHETAEWYAYYISLGSQLAQAAGGAAILGLLGGLLGALLSLALAPPAHRLPNAPAR